MIRIYLHKDAATDANHKALRSFASWATEALQVKDQVHVSVLNGEVLCMGVEYGGDYVFGAYLWPPRKIPKSFPHRILMAGHAAGDPFPEEVVEILAHELVHYEQWRSGRLDPTERGVAVRARNLVKKWKKATEET